MRGPGGRHTCRPAAPGVATRADPIGGRVRPPGRRAAGRRQRGPFERGRMPSGPRWRGGQILCQAVLMTVASYQVRRARSADEMTAAVALRHEVFCVEQGVPEWEELDGRDQEGI